MDGDYGAVGLPYRLFEHAKELLLLRLCNQHGSLALHQGLCVALQHPLLQQRRECELGRVGAK